MDLAQQAVNLVTGAGGATPSTLGSAMAIWNAIVLAIGTAIAGYIVIAGVLKTAHEGEALGQKWSSMWIPLRAAVALALVAPMTSGFSLAQQVILDAVQYSSDAADTIWQTVGVDLTSGKVPAFIVPPSQSTTKIFSDLAHLESCVTAYNSEASAAAAAMQEPPQLMQLVQSTVPEFWDYNKNHYKLQLTTTTGTGRDGQCGAFTWQIGATQNPDPVASAQAAAIASTANALATPLNQQFITGQPADLTQPLANFASAWQTASSTAQAPDPALADAGTAAADAGWASAGSYYIAMSQKTSKAMDAATSVPVTNRRIDEALPYFDAIKTADQTTDRALQLADSTTQAETDQDKSASGWGALLHPFMSLQSYIVSLMHSQPDPVLRIQNLGHYMLDTAWTAVGVGAVVKAAATVSPLGKAAASLGLGGGMSTPVVILFLVGALAAYVLPAIPYVLTLLATAGWLVNVVILIVAAPVWAIAHATPDGHDAFGSGGAGYMFALEILIRPSLIVIGLLVGMSVMTACDFLLASGFEAAFFSTQSGNVTGLVGLLVGITMYILLMMTIILMSFRLINTLPQRVLRVIGGGSGDSVDAPGGSIIAAAGQFVMNRGSGAAGAARGGRRAGGGRAAGGSASGGSPGGGGAGNGIHMPGGPLEASPEMMALTSVVAKQNGIDAPDTTDFDTIREFLDQESNHYIGPRGG